MSEIKDSRYFDNYKKHLMKEVEFLSKNSDYLIIALFFKTLIENTKVTHFEDWYKLNFENSKNV